MIRALLALALLAASSAAAQGYQPPGGTFVRVSTANVCKLEQDCTLEDLTADTVSTGTLEAVSGLLSAADGEVALHLLADGARLHFGTGLDTYLTTDGTKLLTPVELRGLRFASTAADGQNAIQLITNGARLDLGSGTNDYWKSDGSSISTPGNLVVGEKLRVDGELSAANFVSNEYVGQPVKITDADGIAINNTTAITHHIIEDVTLDFPLIASMRAETLTGTVTGASVGDAVSVNPQCALDEALVIAHARVSATNTVTLSVVNTDGEDYNPPSCTFTFDVRRWVDGGIIFNP